MTTKLNWGILGAGNISAQFVHDLCLNNSRDEKEFIHVVRAIGSSSTSKADEFIKSNDIHLENNGGILPISQSYDDLYANPEVDIIYIGTPHNFHKEQSIASLEHGKHVLCEKPFTVNGKESREVMDVAKKNNKFLMEAVWTRFFPSILTLQKYIFEDKILGDVSRLMMDFAYYAGVDKLSSTSRVRNVELAGGALLDIGIYTLTYARSLLDNKVGANSENFELKAFQTIDQKDKVDYVTSIIMRYENGKQAILTSTNLGKPKSPYLRLDGSKGSLEMWSDNPAAPRNYKITFNDHRDDIIYEDKTGYFGFIYEANAAARDIQKGNIQNDIIPWDETLLIMDTMDTIRKENGLVYPQD